jgi:hypothetical protein
MLLITLNWWQFDSRLSCDRLPYWGEWIECLHGTSHLYIPMAEIAVGSWFVGGAAMLLGRFLPRYISVIVPARVAIAFIGFIVGYWYTAITPYRPFGEPIPWDIFRFAIIAGVLAVYLMGPVAGAWLFGLSARAVGYPRKCRELRDLAWRRTRAQPAGSRRAWLLPVGLT